MLNWLEIDTVESIKEAKALRHHPHMPVASVCNQLSGRLIAALTALGQAQEQYERDVYGRVPVQRPSQPGKAYLPVASQYGEGSTVLADGPTGGA